MEKGEKRNRLNRSYLVRFWRHQSTVPWRVTVQDVQSKEQLHFAEMAELWVFLEGVLEVPENDLGKRPYEGG